MKNDEIKHKKREMSVPVCDNKQEKNSKSKKKLNKTEKKEKNSSGWRINADEATVTWLVLSAADWTLVVRLLRTLFHQLNDCDV